MKDDQGNVCLAHKGGLGGGKYTVAPGPFGELINGFERETVKNGDRQLSYFVLGSFDNPALLISQLLEFVLEAQRIRDLRRQDRRFKSALRIVGGAVGNAQSDDHSEYTGETFPSGSGRLADELRV